MFHFLFKVFLKKESRQISLSTIFFLFLVFTSPISVVVSILGICIIKKRNTRTAFCKLLFSKGTTGSWLLTEHQYWTFKKMLKRELQ